MAAFRGSAAKLLALVGEALAIKQAGHPVGGGDDRGAGFPFPPHLRLMLQVDIAAPAEQDERDIQGERDQGDLEARTQVGPGDRQFLEEVGSVPDEQEYRGNQDDEHHHVPPGIGERHVPVPRRGLSKRQTAHKTGINPDCLIFCPRWREDGSRDQAGRNAGGSIEFVSPPD